MVRALRCAPGAARRRGRAFGGRDRRAGDRDPPGQAPPRAGVMTCARRGEPAANPDGSVKGASMDSTTKPATSHRIASGRADLDRAPPEQARAAAIRMRAEHLPELRSRMELPVE